MRVIGRPDVLLAKIASRGRQSIELTEELPLEIELFGHRFEHEPA